MADDIWEKSRRQPVQLTIDNRAEDAASDNDDMTPFERAVCDPTHHGFTKEDLARHGVAWPPRKGWRSMMKAQIKARVKGTRFTPRHQTSPSTPAAAPPKQQSRPIVPCSYLEDRKQVDLVGFAETATRSVIAGPKDTVVMEQRGFFATSMGRYGKERVARYVVFRKRDIPALIKELQAIAKGKP